MITRASKPRTWWLSRWSDLFLSISAWLKELLETIKRYIVQHGYSPTVRDLAKLNDTGVGTVHRHLNELIYGGYIKGAAS